MTFIWYPFIIVATATVAIIVAFQYVRWILRQQRGSEAMCLPADRIAQGARSFLRTEYRAIALFVLPTALLLAYLGHLKPSSTPFIGLTFFFGALFSALAGLIGMLTATAANVRTAQAARTSLATAFEISFAGGTVMGLTAVGLSLLGIGSLLIVVSEISVEELPIALAIELLTGFALGAEAVALFARVAGGIYTKAADVGADIVGKIEAALPEDDPRNPATIADNVGDNVGDVAGMGADLTASYISTLVGTMVLGAQVSTLMAMLPLYIAVVGILISLVILMGISLRNEEQRVQRLLDLANLLATLCAAVAIYLLLNHLLISPITVLGHRFTSTSLALAACVGLVTGLLISLMTAYITTAGKPPVDSIIAQSVTGPATNLIAGLSVGLLSTALPTLLFVAAIASSYTLAGIYGVAIAAVAMMSITPLQLAIDAFGPIADNAGGIAEMAGLPEEVRQRTDILDMVGNTTAATGKGFAIASAALTSLALFAAFVQTTAIPSIDVAKAPVLAGLLLGSMLPLLFSALTMRAVGSAAMQMIQEVRRQLRTIPGLAEGKVAPDYERCIAISTHAALWQTGLPASLAIFTPLAVGFVAGAEVLGAYLAGVLVSGIMMGLFQCNAGGAWDNAKKAFEKGVEVDGTHYGKGSHPHQASVVGDTVGDPCKDTSGPAMNILIKLTAIIALTVAPFLSY